jgi:PhoPQ-activated pathogenicity-related protein
MSPCPTDRIARPTWLIALAAFLSVAAGPPDELFDYLKKPEPAFAWKQTSNHDLPGGKVVTFEFTSQTWRGGDWTHQLRVYEPEAVTYPDLMLLYITGGRNGDEVKPENHAQYLALARACGGRVAVLPQVPNQPLLDNRLEDDLIGETFVNYMKTQEPDWPLLLPMVKSAVRAMDALEAWAKEKGHPVEGFVVTGASKRGWTTWLTAAADERVKAIAPMVIPTLNMRAQSKYQLESWGKYSEQIEDYTRRGLTEKFDDPVGSVLWRLIDPYSYLDRIKMPVLQINGTNDRYWTLDSLNLYWDDIQAPKFVTYLPNAGHGLDKNREWATNGIAALFRHVASGRPMPRFESSHEIRDDRPKVNIDRPSVSPKAITLWVARSDTRDFREATWEPVHSSNRRVGPSGGVGLVAERPEKGYIAVFIDLTYDDLDDLEYHLATPIAIYGVDGPQVEPKPDAAR